MLFQQQPHIECECVLLTWAQGVLAGLAQCAPTTTALCHCLVRTQEVLASLGMLAPAPTVQGCCVMTLLMPLPYAHTAVVAGLGPCAPVYHCLMCTQVLCTIHDQQQHLGRAAACAHLAPPQSGSGSQFRHSQVSSRHWQWPSALTQGCEQWSVSGFGLLSFDTARGAGSGPRFRRGEVNSAVTPWGSACAIVICCRAAKLGRGGREYV